MATINSIVPKPSICISWDDHYVIHLTQNFTGITTWYPNSMHPCATDKCFLYGLNSDSDSESYPGHPSCVFLNLSCSFSERLESQSPTTILPRIISSHQLPYWQCSDKQYNAVNCQLTFTLLLFTLIELGLFKYYVSFLDEVAFKLGHHCIIFLLLLFGKQSATSPIM